MENMEIQENQQDVLELDWEDMGIRELQENLIQVREAFIQFTDAKYQRMYRRTLDNLDKFHCEMENSQLPLFSIDTQNISQMELMKVKRMLKKEIQLLNILALKVNCPISQIVDKL